MNAEPTVYQPESLTEVAFIDLQTTSSEKARARKKLKRNLLILFNLVFAGFILLPLLYAVSVAFMPSNELFTTEVNLLPQTITLNNFKEALIKILTEPKNALVKQYQKLLEMDDVVLEFRQDALEAIVDKAIERKTGARGLRSIIEEIMRDIMFDVPSTPDIEKCIIHIKNNIKINRVLMNTFSTS